MVAFVAGVAVAGGGAYAVTSTAPKISACVDNRTKAMYLTDKTKCPVGRTLVSWNVAGPQGPAGEDGITKDNSGNLSIKDIAKKVLPTVVSISVSSTTGSGTGSGSIVQSDATKSYIVTNNHVIDDAVSGGKVTVEFQDGTELTATIKGRDIAYDLAVLEISKGNLPTISTGDSSKVLIGDLSVAIGSPLGLSGTVTSGIISALNRPVLAGSTNQASYIDALQTDAAVNPGNSGGPLVNGQGEMIGVNSAIASLGASSAVTTGNIGLGFAIPINQAMRVVNEIIKSGKSTRPLLGVEFDRQYNGNGKILGLVKDGAAEKAGIPVNSIIKSIDGFGIKSDIDAVVRIRSYAPNSTVSITVELPSGELKTFSVTLGSAPANQ
ncbi:MAG: PDZ domain-containing protein [Actinobacteria bacterium]|nr:PDZ domain-containing protein [Actinomycetota bacterium]